MADPYATGVLHREHHERLVAGLDGFARDAGIAPHWIWTPLADVCGPAEVEYVKAFRHHMANGETFGLCYVKKSDDVQPSRRMAAIAGALVRNFIRARVLSLGQVLDAIAAGEPPQATCLMIPNFFVPRSEGGGLASWQVSALHDLLTQREMRGLQTVIYAPDLELLSKEYGVSFARAVRAGFVVVEI